MRHPLLDRGPALWAAYRSTLSDEPSLRVGWSHHAGIPESRVPVQPQARACILHQHLRPDAPSARTTGWRACAPRRSPWAPRFDAGLTWEQARDKRLALLGRKPGYQVGVLLRGEPDRPLRPATSTVEDNGNHYAMPSSAPSSSSGSAVPWAAAGQATIATRRRERRGRHVLGRRHPARFPPGMATPTPRVTPTPTRPPWTSPPVARCTIRITRAPPGMRAASTIPTAPAATA